MRRASEEEPDQAASDELDPFISTSSHRMNLDASGIAMKELNTTSKYVDSPVTDEPSIEHDDSRSDEPSRRPRAQSRLAEGPVTRVHRAAFIWLSGPEQPRPFSIKPIFPSFQTAPLSLIRLRQPKHWAYLYLAFCIVWFASFVSIIHISVYGCSVPGYDSVIRSSCTSQFWKDSTECGIDGINCRPFHNTTFAFSCPASCSSVQVLDPYTIGGTEINYRSLVIGGLKTDAKGSGSVYRGDSFICPAAIHAGVIADGYGGAGVVSLIGEQRAFPATESNGISSVAFGPSFPLAFTFLKASGSSQCSDPRWRILIFSSLCTALLSLFTTSTLVFYCTSFVGIYFTVALATDPSDFKEFHMVVSYALGNFLPCAFIGLIIYRYCVMRTLHNLRAQYEKTVLWLGACWVGALNNYTFDRLPIQRLTPHDIKAQPGALTVVIFLSLAILAAALGQIWAFRIEGRLLRYLAFYALLGLLILGLILIPGMNLRLHHYIIALLLLPGTAIQTRPSLLYQGLLVGLFINGIARWGFDSILQTPAELFKTNLNDLVPQIAIPKMEGSNITFNWDKIASGYDSISILINDVERFRGYEDHNTNSFSWERYHDGEPEYFRFGYVKYGQIGGSKVGKYTHPGVWEPNGTWAMVPISYPTHPSSHRGGPYRGGVGDFINHLWDGLGPVNRV